MPSPQPEIEPSALRAAEAPPYYLPVRAELAHRFITGEGLEIGALNWPLEVPSHARVRQVDRMSVAELRSHYPEMADLELAIVDVIDDGETLATIADGSQDFIVANHFLEHTGDPIGTIGNHLRKLKPGGVLFYAIPDKRYTFDFRRPLTPLEHMVADHEQGAERSRRQHFDEWAELVEEGKVDARELEANDYSIHTHVWTQASFLALILACQERFEESFEIEAAAQHGLELVVVLRKRGGWPSPVEGAATVAHLERNIAEISDVLDETASELRAVKASPSWRITRPLRAAKARLTGRR